jgi:HK97 family phage prohead protease
MGKHKQERRFLAVELTGLELRAGTDASQPAQLVGYAAVFNQPTLIRDWFSEWEETIAPGAFRKTLGEADIRALFNHDPSLVLGRNKAGTLLLSEDTRGLHTTITPPDSEWGRPVVEAVKRGDVSGMSVALQVVKETWVWPKTRKETTKRTILEARLFDVSPVTFPAYETTSIAARANGSVGAGTTEAETEDVIETARRWLRLHELGMPLADGQRQTLREALTILQNACDEPVLPSTETADHSSRQNGEPGLILRYHSPAMRARWLELLSKQLEAGRE